MRDDEILKYEAERRIHAAWAKSAAACVLFVSTAGAITCNGEAEAEAYTEGLSDAHKECDTLTRARAITKAAERLGYE